MMDLGERWGNRRRVWREQLTHAIEGKLEFDKDENSAEATRSRALVQDTKIHRSTAVRLHTRGRYCRPVAAPAAEWHVPACKPPRGAPAAPLRAVRLPSALAPLHAPPPPASPTPSPPPAAYLPPGRTGEQTKKDINICYAEKRSEHKMLFELMCDNI